MSLRLNKILNNIWEPNGKTSQSHTNLFVQKSSLILMNLHLFKPKLREEALPCAVPARSRIQFSGNVWLTGSEPPWGERNIALEIPGLC